MKQPTAQDPSIYAHEIEKRKSSGHTQWYPTHESSMKLKQPTSQLSLVLYKLLLHKKPITIAHFKGYPRISEYIRLLRQKEKLEIKTIPIKFVTQFGTKSEYASYKLISRTKDAIQVYEKLISK